MLLVLGANTQAIGKDLGKYGIKVSFCFEDEKLNHYSQDLYAHVVANFVKDKGYQAVAAGTSPFGKDLLPRVAAKLEAGMISDCVGLEANGDKLVAKRPHFAGKCLSKAEVCTSVGVYSIRPNIFKAQEKGSEAGVENWSCDLPEAKAQVQDIQKGQSAKADLTEATYIVSGGRAMGNSDNFKVLNELADTIGATVGASRAAVDSGYAPHSMQVGQTGKTVNPVLYMACGISGAIQHLAGMRTSKVIVAINKDPEAPIFSKADYGIVGDLFEVVPEVDKAFKELLGK